MKKQRKNLSKDMRLLIICLTILMAMASVMVKVIEVQSDNGSTLTLQGSAPYSEDPLFVIESNPNARYLRSALGIEYDGSSWRLHKIAGQFQNINRTADEYNTLPICTTAPSQSYHDFDRDMLNQSGVINDLQTLQLPDNISDRIYELSLRITKDMDTPFEKAKAIETFLRVRYKYTLDYVPAPDDWEPNDWFLFESKEGICGNFNSAFVILARAAGLPARMAAGYYVKAGMGEQQVVYANQAHAWAEVGFEGFGWLAFEATPP